MSAPIREEIKRISLSAHEERSRSILDVQPPKQAETEAEPSLFVKLRSLVSRKIQNTETNAQMSEEDYEKVARSLGHEGLAPLDLGDEEQHTSSEDTEEAPQKRSP